MQFIKTRHDQIVLCNACVHDVFVYDHFCKTQKKKKKEEQLGRRKGREEQTNMLRHVYRSEQNLENDGTTVSVGQRRQPSRKTERPEKWQLDSGGNEQRTRRQIWLA